MNFYKFILGAIAAPTVFAVLEHHASNLTSSALVQLFETALYVHYGPQDLTVSGEVIHLSSDELCKPGDAVRDKVVVVTSRSSKASTICTLSELYTALNVRSSSTTHAACSHE